MNDIITLTLTYQESLIIRHALESYADKWCADIRSLVPIVDCEYATADMKELAKEQLKQLDIIRIETQRLWSKVSHAMYSASSVPEHIVSSFQNPESND